MSTIKEKAKKYATKAKHFTIGAAMVPLMGVGAHMGSSLLSESDFDGPSLHDRFETAYSFKTPEEHKYYTVARTLTWYETACADDETWEEGCVYENERYLAAPWATYPAMLAFGLFGVSVGAAYEETKRKAKIMDVKQRTR